MERTQTFKPGRSLCLNCRTPGHILSACPEPLSGNELGWIVSPQRKLMRATSMPDPADPNCARCESLTPEFFNLLTLPDEEVVGDTGEDGVSSPEKNGHIVNLGPSAEVIFDENCPLCYCLFMICPNPTKPDQQVLVTASLTIWRLASLSTGGDRDEGGSTKCLIVVLSPTQLPFMASNTDALCLIQESQTTVGRSLGARMMNKNGYSQELLEGWLAACERLHPTTCSRYWQEDLRKIFLVDVNTRQVVRYPPGKCDFVALSYVWGKVKQASVKAGTILEELPQTIEDAITFVKALGKQYLWVDSLCIDQSNELDKKEQIALMCSIYEGSYATIIAATGASAASGLPRANPNIDQFEQVSCTMKGRTLTSLMPSLNFLLTNEVWAKRAWTFQEALLSPRCFYFTKHQIYFECNAMTCCESLNETASAVHKLKWDTAFIESGAAAESHGKGILRNPFVGLSRKPIRFQEYGHLLTLYSYREMTNDSDGLNAFSGILQAMTHELYPKGFHWGLPIEDFDYGLLWAGRYEHRSRAGFPSWSWAAWDMSKWPTISGDVDPGQHSNLRPYLRITQFDNGKPELLYENAGLDTTLAPPKEINEDSADMIDISRYPPTTYPGLIHITGTILRMEPHAYKPSSGPWIERHQTTVLLKDEIFAIDYNYCGDLLESRFGNAHDFLLVARRLREGYVVHYLLMLEWDEGKEVARRVAPVELWIEEGLADTVLEDANPRTMSFLLA